ncbi:putative metallophosphoesterase At3g03305 [Typha angustifolia]|uniref:putative metallophosphoesterase At3g03305 n=1 Tax=Typha angustifolia TaxID=59011 RepID=UPI003C30EA7E
MASPITSNLLLFSILFFSSSSNLLLFPFVVPLSVGTLNDEAGGEVDPLVTRASFPMDGDVAWVVQVTDLHVSAYHPDRADDLVRLLAPVLRIIRPSLLLITGDITDAKNKKRTSSRQDESEWVVYRNAIDAIVKRGGIDKHRIFDIRGNHDKYGVPYVGHKLDFFSTHSVSSQLNRLSTIYSISLMEEDKRYIFLGIDDTLSVGIRGPSNLFGHPTDKMIKVVNSELQYWDKDSKLVTKVVFGHFPMSFSASSEKGERYETTFARQSISAYICGHLHAKFSKKLWKLHSVKFASDAKELQTVQNFWEWELGDWKENKLVRILAIDGGVVSFLDIELSRNQLQEEFQTTIFITYPTDSTSMNTFDRSSQSMRRDINALVFSAEEILNVTAKVYDSFRKFKIVEEIPLQLVTSLNVQKPLFHAKWNAESYKSLSPTRYWLQVIALDSQGKETSSKIRPFSVEGKPAIQSPTWLKYLIFEIQWEGLYLVLLWSNLGFLFLLLSIPKLLYHFVERSAKYKKWAMSVFSSPIQQRNTQFWVLWFLMEGSRSRKCWFSLVIYLLWLITMPWFWGRATSESGDIGQMYLSGWKIQSPDHHITTARLGTPDVMVITLPFMYLVVTPVVVLTYGLLAEKSVVYLRSSRKARFSNGTINLNLESGHQLEVVARASPSSLKDIIASTLLKICGGWARRILLLACMIIALVHFKLCYTLMCAYGVGPVALSPTLSWAPPLLLVQAVYSTMGTED